MNAERQATYCKMVADIAGATIVEQKVCPFCLVRGDNYDRGLLIIGRSVNGWEYSYAPTDGAEKSVQNEIVEQLESYEAEGLHWVYSQESPKKGYNTRKSAFWRVTKRIALSRKIVDDREIWSTYLAWTNLYKVSNAVKGNPSETLCSVQFPYCKKLLLMEIKQLKPRMALFLTGANWALPFIQECISADDKRRKGSLVDYAGRLKMGEYAGGYIIAKHPQGKNESDFVDEVESVWSKMRTI
jgi:hypothetical protein